MGKVLVVMIIVSVLGGGWIRNEANQIISDTVGSTSAVMFVSTGGFTGLPVHRPAPVNG